MLKELTVKEQICITKYAEGKDRKTIASEMNVSVERVRQLLSKATRKQTHKEINLKGDEANAL